MGGLMFNQVERHGEISQKIILYRHYGLNPSPPLAITVYIHGSCVAFMPLPWLPASS
jgi:hypothetical protein